MSQPELLVSFREFAKMVGLSEGAVRKAVNNNSIQQGVGLDEKGNRKIYPTVAAQEWGKELKTETAEEAEVPKATPAPVEVKLVRFSELEKTDEEEVEVDDLTDYVYTGDEDVLNDPKEIAEFLKDIPPNTTKVEAERIFSVMRARKAKRELQKLEGELVDKGLVYNNLYEFAAIIRDGFNNVPDRVIDMILAADTRNEAINILSEEINSVLRSLAGIGEIKLTAE